MQLARLHHVTCVCADAQQTLDFYRDELGFTLVKKTVNFDDPHSYHLYFGDEAGGRARSLTFFEWPRAEPGRLGRGTLESIGLVTPGVAVESRRRGSRRPASTALPGPAPRLRDVVVIGNVDLYAGLVSEDGPLEFAEPVEEAALIGPGTTHHIAFRAADEPSCRQWLDHLAGMGLRPTEIQDRTYFRSVYFRMPDGVLVEIATDGPGLPRRRDTARARPEPRAPAVARARARDPRARADTDR